MKVIKNYLYNLSYQLLTIILSIITVPYITRVFTSEELGEYGFYNSILSYFLLISMLGVSIYGTKRIAVTKDVNSEFWNIYAIQLMMSIISTVVYFVVIVSLPNANIIIPIILSIGLLTKFTDISWLFFGLEDFRRITLRNAIVKLLGVVSILIFIKNGNQLYLYIFFLVIFEFIGQLVTWFPAKRILRKPSFNIKKIRKNIKPMFILFLPQVSISLYALIDRTLLGALGSYADVGIYDQGQKLTNILIIVVSTLGSAMLPRVANLLAENKTQEAENMLRFSFLLYNLIIFPMIFGVISVNSIFIDFFLGENFSSVKYVLYITVFNVMFVGWSNILGNQVLVVLDKNREFMISTTIPAIASVFVNIFLIPKFGFVGASFASVFVQFLVFAMQWYYCRNLIDKNLLLNKTLLKVLVSTAIMFITIEAMKYFLELRGILGLIVYAIGGGMVYLGSNAFLKTVKISEVRKMLK